MIKKSMVLAGAAMIGIALLSGGAGAQGTPQTIELVKVDVQKLAAGYRVVPYETLKFAEKSDTTGRHQGGAQNAAEVQIRYGVIPTGAAEVILPGRRISNGVRKMKETSSDNVRTWRPA